MAAAKRRKGARCPYFRPAQKSWIRVQASFYASSEVA